jgi:beta-lactamase class A
MKSSEDIADAICDEHEATLLGRATSLRQAIAEAVREAWTKGAKTGQATTNRLIDEAVQETNETGDHWFSAAVVPVLLLLRKRLSATKAKP